MCVDWQQHLLSVSRFVGLTGRCKVYPSCDGQSEIRSNKVKTYQSVPEL